MTLGALWWKNGVVMIATGGGSAYGGGLVDNEPESSIYAIACVAFVLVSIFAALVVISVIARLWF